MADTLTRPMTLQEFLAWEDRQEGRHEFVRGRIVAMVGGTRRHSKVGANVLSCLTQRLNGHKCQAYGPDMKIITPAGNSRYGDVTVDCGPMKGDDIAATAPAVVVEVLSKSTTFLDQNEKLDDYQSIPSMRHISHLSQEKPEGELWSRDESGWRRIKLAGPDAIVDLGAIGISFALVLAYEGVPFETEEGADTAT